MGKFIDTLTRRVAKTQGYTAAEIEAGVQFFKRKERLSHPDGSFDNAGRFEAAERTDAVQSARTPSRAFPYSEMDAARTAKHCAELFDVDPLAVKRIARVLDLETDLPADVSQHAFLAASVKAEGILKPMKRVEKRHVILSNTGEDIGFASSEDEALDLAAPDKDATLVGEYWGEDAVNLAGIEDGLGVFIVDPTPQAA
jgi:hypothetical protein